MIGKNQVSTTSQLYNHSSNLTAVWCDKLCLKADTPPIAVSSTTQVRRKPSVMCEACQDYFYNAWIREIMLGLARFMEALPDSFRDIILLMESFSLFIILSREIVG